MPVSTPIEQFSAALQLFRLETFSPGIFSFAEFEFVHDESLIGPVASAAHSLGHPSVPSISLPGDGDEVPMLRAGWKPRCLVAGRKTPGEKVLGSISLWPPAPYWLGRCQYNVTG